MIILINGSNLKMGGGLQVADSFCRTLDSFPEHKFHVVLSAQLKSTINAVASYKNVTCHEYSVSNKRIPDILSGRDRFLDDIVRRNGIEAVVSIFGPIYWKPECPHLVGFARAQILASSSSPYLQLMSPRQRFAERSKNIFIRAFFRRSGDMFYTENEEVSEKVKKVFRTDKVITATNTYNQVFTHPEDEREYKLPAFDGITLLTVSSRHVHKNLNIIPEVADILIRKHPEFNFRFIVTVPEDAISGGSKEARRHVGCIGTVNISQCPSLYRQSDIEFQPTLLECFTATYPEAMITEKPIVTTDLDFSRGLCGDAAVYYRPMDAEDAAEAIFRVAEDKNLAKKLVEAGKKQLLKFDDYQSRARKIIDYISKVSDEKNI